MEKVIIIKYGELSTKKDNKNFFLSKLKNNIDLALQDIDHVINYDYGRMFIRSNDIEKVVERLKYVFGIQGIIIGYTDKKMNLDSIKQNAITLLRNKSFKSFKVVTKRSNKNFELNSMEVSRIIGGEILKNIEGIMVDVHNPEVVIEIEIRNNEILYYFESILGIGGYTVGSLGIGMLMLSGGIDSPVAGYLTIKRGVKIEAIYFESPPHTSEKALEKVSKLTKELAKYNLDMKLHVINFTEIQETILKNIPHEYLITIMRRMMYRISAIMAHKNKCSILVNGESIGQVASQTLNSMYVINEVVKMPVIRPVACFDKLEIIDIAKKIGTYETSILPFEDCCTIFVPKHPVINPELEKCISYEELIPYEELINKAIHDSKVERFTMQEDYSDLL